MQILRSFLILSCLASCAAQAGPPAPRLPDTCGPAKLTAGRAMPTIVSRPKPQKGVVHADPSFQTCVVRATDHIQEGIEGFSRSDYSRRQAFNANSTLFFTNTREGGWYIYDARTLQKLKGLEGLHGDAEPQWHPTDPNVLYYGERNGGLKISSLDVRSMNSRVVIDLNGKLPWKNAMRAWTKSEGSPSRDGRYWAFQVETEKFEILGLAVWDLVNNKLVSTMSTHSRPDHVSMSPSGRWVVGSGDDGTTAWSIDFKTKKLMQKRTEHSDLVVGANGHDIYASIDYASGEGYIIMVDIDTGVRTDLIRTYINGAATAMHFSGKAYDKPGWVLISTYNPGGPPQWYMEKLFIMELAPNPRIYQIAAHHSAVKDAYFAEPQATVNRDFTRVLFNSNWGVPGSNDIDTYMVLINPGAFP